MADERWTIIDRHRLRRSPFQRSFDNSAAAAVTIEACANAHVWARELRRRGSAVPLLPAPKVTCALTNQLARIATAVWTHQSAFGANHPPPLAA